jgi:hypothetical protein
MWVAPCPVSDADIRGCGNRKRRVKERMDDRTRQRQPVLSTLVEHMENRHGHIRELLAQVAGAASGDTVTVGGRTYRPRRSRVDERRVRLGGPANVRALDLEIGKYINVTHAEDAAFWEWAIVEVLRHSGARIEEALELTHLSTRQYQRPNGEVIALLVVAPSKSDRERVIPMSAELSAVVAAIIRRHTAVGETIPLLSRYDPKERRSTPRCRSCPAQDRHRPSRLPAKGVARPGLKQITGAWAQASHPRFLARPSPREAQHPQWARRPSGTVAGYEEHSHCQQDSAGR